jgi:hypothetical protein
MLDQVNGVDAVNGFNPVYQMLMFAPSFYLKEKDYEESYQLVP